MATFDRSKQTTFNCDWWLIVPDLWVGIINVSVIFIKSAGQPCTQPPHNVCKLLRARGAREKEIGKLFCGDFPI